MQVAFKQGTSVLEILFGVGFDGGDASKRFLQDADEALLFRKRRDSNADMLNVRLVDRGKNSAFFARDLILE